MKDKTIFWDDDTQFDFMNPEGKLYVPGAEDIIEKVSKIREYALSNEYSIIASCDWHSLTNPEISENPDYKTTFPPHCMANSTGARRVGYLGQMPAAVIDVGEMKLANLKKLVSADQFHIEIRKNDLDVFSNPNTSVLLGLIRPQRIFIFGVAIDFCVQITVEGLLERHIPEVIILSDAVKGLGTRPDEEILNNFAAKGVKITEFDKSLFQNINV